MNMASRKYWDRRNSKVDVWQQLLSCDDSYEDEINFWYKNHNLSRKLLVATGLEGEIDFLKYTV